MCYEINKRAMYYIAETWLNATIMYQVYKDQVWKAIVRDRDTDKKYEVVSRIVNDRIQVYHTDINGTIVVEESEVKV